VFLVGSLYVSQLTLDSGDDDGWMGWTWERVDGAWEWIQTARHLRRASPMQPMGARNALTLKPSITNTKYEGNTVPYRTVPQVQ